MRSTYAPREIRSGDQSLRDQDRSVETGALTIPQPHSEEKLRARSSRAIIYLASLPAFLVLAVLTWTQFDFSRRDIPDFKPVLALADSARQKGRSLLREAFIFAGGEARSLARRLGRVTCPRLRD